MVPYIVPSENFLSYLKERHVKRVIDAGVDAIFMEEPEFWARAGYSESFKKEWKKYYGFDWRPQHESPENTYLSSKLKYYLYYRALNEVFTFAKEYGKSKGMDVKCYVPTHSLVNYSQWQIVSPEASLASLPCVDGYIAQVWTGTSREPNFFDGRKRERVFETAYLEYGSMESMTAPTGRKMFFLTDPIEDWPRDWADYKKNYHNYQLRESLFQHLLCIFHGIHNSECFVVGFHIFIFRNTVSDNTAARLNIHMTIFFDCHADRDTSIQVSGKIKITECTAVNPTLFTFQFFDDLTCTDLWCTGKRSGRQDTFNRT